MTKSCRNNILIFLILIVTVIFSGCGKGNDITIKGSDTMLPLVSRWAEVFMTANPEMRISVTGGGSETGIAALLNGKVDLAASSRDITVIEVNSAKSRGLDIFLTPVAFDGIAVVVNPSNPVSELTIDQLKGIFTGEFSNWSEVGGAAGDIVILSRESNSGTFVFFQKYLLANLDYAASALLMSSSSSIIQGVRDGKTAVGYVGLGYAKNAGESVKILLLQGTGGAASVMPTGETITEASYPIARNLYIFVNGEPTGAVKAFTEFILSETGQQIVSDVGYIPIPERESIEEIGK